MPDHERDGRPLLLRQRQELRREIAHRLAIEGHSRRGHDFGNQIEIVAGLNANDQVVINPPDSIVSGQKVQIVQGTLPGDAK